MTPGRKKQTSFDLAIGYLTSTLFENTKASVCAIRVSVSAERIDQKLDACTSIAEKTKFATSYPGFLRAGIKFLTLHQSWENHHEMIVQMTAGCFCDIRQAGMKDFHTYRRKPADDPITAIFEAVTTISNFLILAVNDLKKHRFRTANATGIQNWPQGPDDLLPYGLEGSAAGLRNWFTVPSHGCIIFKLIGSLALFYTPFSEKILYLKRSHLFIMPIFHLREAIKFYNEKDMSSFACAQFFTYPVKTVLDYFDTLQLCDNPQFNQQTLECGDLISPVLTDLLKIVSTLPEEWRKYRHCLNLMMGWATAKTDPETGLYQVVFSRETLIDGVELLEIFFESIAAVRNMGCLNIACSSADKAIHSRLCSRCNVVNFCGEKCQKEAWKYTTLPHKPLCSKIHSLRESLGPDNWSLLWSPDFTYSDFKDLCRENNIDVEDLKAICITLHALQTAQKMYQDDSTRAGASQKERLIMAERQKALAKHRKDAIESFGLDPKKIMHVERKDTIAFMSEGAISG